MLSNAYFLAKFRFDTAENEPAKNLQNFRKMHFRKMHFSKILQIFGGLVFGCIKPKFCKKVCVRQHFSSSTRFASFCTAAISKFSQTIGLKNQTSPQVPAPGGAAADEYEAALSTYCLYQPEEVGCQAVAGFQSGVAG